MPTTKDRTPAAWRSQVPPEVRSLARGAVDLKGEIGTNRDQGQSPRTETGKGPIYRFRGLQTRQCQRRLTAASRCRYWLDRPAVHTLS